MEYKDYFIAFIDVLGFKKLINEKSCEYIYEIFSDLHLLTKDNLVYNGKYINAYDKIKHKILSDSIIIFVDAEIEDAFAALIDVCNKLQETLAKKEGPIFIRGGITKGPLFENDDIIYGQGLIKAYLLESEFAKYPRVIFTEETLESGKSNAKYMRADLSLVGRNFTLDEDEFYYLNYLPRYQGMSTEQIKGYCDGLFECCSKELNCTTDRNLREKYLWIKRKVQKSVEKMPEIKALYEKELGENWDREIKIHHDLLNT